MHRKGNQETNRDPSDNPSDNLSGDPNETVTGYLNPTSPAVLR